MQNQMLHVFSTFLNNNISLNDQKQYLIMLLFLTCNFSADYGAFLKDTGWLNIQAGLIIKLQRKRQEYHINKTKTTN